MTPYRDPEDALEANRRWRKNNQERIRELWRAANRRRIRRKKDGVPPPRRAQKRRTRVADMDAEPRRCLWHFWAADGGCPLEAAWTGAGDSEWRACDLHKRPGDEPIRPLGPRADHPANSADW